MPRQALSMDTLVPALRKYEHSTEVNPKNFWWSVEGDPVCVMGHVFHDLGYKRSTLLMSHVESDARNLIAAVQCRADFGEPWGAVIQEVFADRGIAITEGAP